MISPSAEPIAPFGSSRTRTRFCFPGRQRRGCRLPPGCPKEVRDGPNILRVIKEGLVSNPSVLSDGGLETAAPCESFINPAENAVGI